MVQPQAVQDGCVEVMDVNRRILYPGSVLHLRNRGPYYGKESPMDAGLTGAVASGRVQGRGFRPMGALIDPIPKQANLPGGETLVYCARQIFEIHFTC